MKYIHAWMIVILTFFSSSSFAEKQFGFRLSGIIYPREIEGLYGLQGMFLYEPEWFYRQVDLYFDAGYSHFWVKHYEHHKQLNIYSIAPIIRYQFCVNGPFYPYIEGSVGFAYLSDTYIKRRNLGLHFAFQDRLGAGIFLGHAKKVFLGVHMLHYSNANLSSHNSGITAPVVLDVGFRFD